MGVIRVEHTADYTVMANCHLRDPRLSLRAVGLMSKMLSLPDGWDYTVSGLAAIVKDGRDAVRKALMELEGAGYLVREQGRSEGGNFARNDYTLYETPHASPLTENPSTVKPSTGLPLTGNSTQSSTNRSSTDQLIPPKPPEGRRARQKDRCEYEPELFERFWKLYPRGEDKAAARYEWDALRPDPELMQIMSSALKRQIETDEWRRGVGIPYACRWLSKRRWEAAEKLEEFEEDEAPERRLAGARC